MSSPDSSGDEDEDAMKRLLDLHRRWKKGPLTYRELGKIVTTEDGLQKAAKRAVVKTCSSELDFQEASWATSMHACIRLLKAATDYSAETNFLQRSCPLFRLPLEIRREIYDVYTDHVMDVEGTLLRCAIPSCGCGRRPPRRELLEMNLASVSKRLSQEFLAFFYGKYLFFFPCTYRLKTLLKSSSISNLFATHIRQIRFDASTMDAVDIFRKLQSCHKLDRLELVFSLEETEIFSEVLEIQGLRKFRVISGPDGWITEKQAAGLEEFFRPIVTG